MPSPAQGMFYSWQLGAVHFVAVNTEAYYFLNYGVAPLLQQYEWLQRELATANEPQNRYNRFLQE